MFQSYLESTRRFMMEPHTKQGLDILTPSPVHNGALWAINTPMPSLGRDQVKRTIPSAAAAAAPMARLYEI